MSMVACPLTEEHYKIAESNGISRKTAYGRYMSGIFDIEEAITKPPYKKRELSAEAIKNNIPRQIYLRRLRDGWSEKDASTVPVGSRARKEKMFPKSVIELAKENGISYNVLWRRCNYWGFNMYDAATTPPRKYRKGKGGWNDGL